MASKTYAQATVTGTIIMRRSTPQGRRRKPEELRKIPVLITMTREGKRLAKQKAKQMNMSLSAYLDLAGTLFSI